MRTLSIAAVLLALFGKVVSADPLPDLRSRYGDHSGWLRAFDLKEMEPIPLIVFHERYQFETLWFAARLYCYEDYRSQDPVETSVTIDPGLPGPVDPNARYYEVDPTLALVPVGDHLGVVSESLPSPPRPYRGRRLLKPQKAAPPAVLVGTVDERGVVRTAVPLPLVERGWTYLCDPFRQNIVRVQKGAYFPPPCGLSPRAWTVSTAELEVVDGRGKPLDGARLDLGFLPGQPGPILVMEHQGTRIAVGSTGPRERELTRWLRSLPGRPLTVDRIEFPRAVFRADALEAGADRLVFRPREQTGAPASAAPGRPLALQSRLYY